MYLICSSTKCRRTAFTSNTETSNFVMGNLPSSKCCGNRSDVMNRQLLRVSWLLFTTCEVLLKCGRLQRIIFVYNNGNPFSGKLSALGAWLEAKLQGFLVWKLTTLTSNWPQLANSYSSLGAAGNTVPLRCKSFNFFNAPKQLLVQFLCTVLFFQVCSLCSEKEKQLCKQQTVTYSRRLKRIKKHMKGRIQLCTDLKSMKSVQY